ncbi:MAG: hypothetical protein HY682_10285 [Chloroflexi bacterium]|nr:hypothetical protein [Chloroflexota bacterium]
MFSSIAFPAVQLLLGRLAALVVYNVAPTHVAAAAAISLEMGLKVTDDVGRRLEWNGRDFPVFVIGWPEHHEVLLAVMNRA